MDKAACTKDANDNNATQRTIEGETLKMRLPPAHAKSLAAILMSALFALIITFFSCDKDPVSPAPKVWSCVIPNENVPDSTSSIGCTEDFTALASEPLDASIPGATSSKTIIDLHDKSGKNPIYFMNCKKYKIHYEFASTNLSGDGKEIVPSLGTFNLNYYNNDRRFVLGAITYYSGPQKWVYEIAPYDKASADMIKMAYQKITESCFFGDSLYFHPSSEAINTEAQKLPPSVKIITTDKLYAGVTYQPLNCRTSIGRLVFYRASELDKVYLTFRDIPVLDVVPNDISVTMGIITESFQTPLAHINVLSHNRGTPNMSLRGAWTNTTLRALEGRWVELAVGPFEYTIREVSKDSADAWWLANSPSVVGIPNMDTTTRELKNVENILDTNSRTVAQALKLALTAFGGKATNFSAFPLMDHSKVPYPKAFGIPLFYYRQFMQENGFYLRVKELLASPQFQDDPQFRDKKLKKLRDDMENAPVDSAFSAMLMAKLKSDFPGVRMRFRSSTNAEDLDGFTGAGLYTSESGGPDDTTDVLDAVKKVWASVWFFRAFEERTYRRIDHMAVGMAMLVHKQFPNEKATGVAITANIFDQSGMEPGFYINVQYDGNSVVLPDSGLTTDEFIYHYYSSGKPIVYIGHSSLLPTGQATVLTDKQVYSLGIALDEIHNYFKLIYGKDDLKKFAMDTEFKFEPPTDDPNGTPILYMKQCRPYY